MTQMKATRRSVILVLTLCTFVVLQGAAGAKIYIDITAPQARTMPIAIYDFDGPGGKEIADVIRDDLVFTGLFSYVDKASYIESSSQPFNPVNWRPLGVEAVVKGTAAGDRGITATAVLYDPAESREILNKQYQADRELLRQLGHTIANDLYAALTGSTGIFRTKIAYVGDRGGEKDLYFMDWDGHRSRKLGLTSGVILAPRWTADGTKLVYSAERGRQWNIYLLDFLQMAERRVFTSKGINMAGSFFPKGNAFLFSSSKEGTPDIYSFSLDTSSLKRLTATHGIEVSPAVSPDGSLIAFVSNRGGTPQIYVMRPDGSEIRRVTFEGTYNTSPAWSPSGDRIAFSGRRNGKNQICIVKPDGTDLQQLTDQGNNEDPSFSPDGRYIAFTSDRERIKGIYLMRANGEGQRRVTPKDLKASSPGWSPN